WLEWLAGRGDPSRKGEATSLALFFMTKSPKCVQNTSGNAHQQSLSSAESDNRNAQQAVHRMMGNKYSPIVQLGPADSPHRCSASPLRGQFHMRESTAQQSYSHGPACDSPDEMP